MAGNERGETETVKSAVPNGANVNAVHWDQYNNKGRIPLVRACKHGPHEIVRILFDAGADAWSTESKYFSPV